MILQSVALGGQVVTEEAVYNSTGSPLPHDIERLVHLLLNSSMKEAVKGMGHKSLGDRYGGWGSSMISAGQRYGMSGAYSSISVVAF